MNVLVGNASALSNIAREVGAVVLQGHLRYPSETGGDLVEAATGDNSVTHLLTGAAGRPSRDKQ